MSDKGFETTIELLQETVRILNSKGYKLYDIENPEFYITEVQYNPDEDKIFVNFEEEKNEQGY